MAQRVTHSPYTIPPQLGVSKRAPLSTLQTYSGNTQFSNFDKDLADGLWTLQVLTLWYTNGTGFKKNGTVVRPNVVTNRGKDPLNPAPILTPSGIALEDMRDVLNPPSDSKDTSWIYGPDAKFGPSLLSLVEDYAGSGRIQGNVPPANTIPILDRMVDRVALVHPSVKRLRDNFRSTKQPAPPKPVAETPTSMLSKDAKEELVEVGILPPSALDTMTSTSSSTTSTSSNTTNTSSNTTSTSSNTPTPKFAEGVAKKEVPDEEVSESEDDNTALYIGLGVLGVALIGGVGFYLHNKNKNSTSATDLAKQPS